MLNRKIAINTVRAFVDACNKRTITFNKVILFGSVAANKVHRNSDIDLALVSDQFSGMTFRDWSMLTPVKISNSNFIDIEPHPFPTDYFEEGDPFIDEIKKTGIEIQFGN